ncbi:hypothetical protein IV73_GL000574 [Weissella kandleri]|uniref:Cyclic-di-AMP phosphodiesterase n=1 Tax=Weissella kandleri TaxID=1616 RepID=A0A0R2JDN8_9LACO|nr:DHH family phosphoesterase [Weissella kandleri]KRN75409.1 hypothetical protein IV73_GL000574 [Weissella kandleri]
MKHFSLFQALPDFFQNRRLTWLAIWVTIMAACGTVLAFMANWLVGIIWVVIIACALVFVFNTLKIIGNNTQKYIASLSYRVNRGEQEALIQMPLGVILYNDKGEINWINPYLQSLSDKSLIDQKINQVSPDLMNLIEQAQIHVDTEKATFKEHLNWLDRQFEVEVQPELQALYLRDVTEELQVQERFEDNQLFIGIVSLDNYDEISERLSDTESSVLHTHVTTTLSDWMDERHIYVRRSASDKYMLMGYMSGLRQAEKDKFKVLNTIRESTSSQNMPITLSIGIAYQIENIAEMATSAQKQLDLALGRGGDQVVVKAPGQDARFYGGTTNPMAKRTRVRARVISQALTELMGAADQIFVMGHARDDMDSMGAALGVRRLAKMVNKPAWVVVDPEVKRHTDMRLLLDEMHEDPQTADAIMTPSEVLNTATEQSLLILVDHSKESMTESRSVYAALKDRLIVIDHHRRGEEFPEQALLVYIESYASSTSELVTELFEYQSRKRRGLSRIEATALLAGIQLDTKSFAIRAGTRTFDAASYLRSMGADGKLIQNFMKDSVEDYRQRAALVAQAQILGSDAVVVADDQTIYDSVSVAQAADSLLQIIGIERSFVVARRDATTVGISARSDGHKNVQTIMEQLGGGGHLSFAATQVNDISTNEAGQELYEVLKKDQADAEMED